MFVLRAQDILADALVEKWAIDANLIGVKWDKVCEARNIAQAMREWPRRKTPD